MAVKQNDTFLGRTQKRAKVEEEENERNKKKERRTTDIKS